MIKAYAKVNLKLKIVGKLDNGYHELDMINVKISLHDSIYIKESQITKIEYSNYKISEEEDTIYKMVISLKKKFPQLPDLKIYIKKRIPVGFGLGGMSSDAAAILNYLNDKYNLSMTMEDKVSFIKEFGTDMVYCLYDFPATVKGIGDIVEPINFILEKKIIFINPNIYISTKEMYQDFDSNTSEIVGLINDFDYIARAKYPEINDIFDIVSMYTNCIPQLSGTGSAVVILEHNKKDYKKIKKELKKLKVKRYNIRKG